MIMMQRTCQFRCKSSARSLKAHLRDTMRNLLVVYSSIFISAFNVAAFQFQAFPSASKRSGCRHVSQLTMSPNSHEEEETSSESRRSLFSKLITIPLLSWTAHAIAAPPMTLGESDGLGARTQRALRPKPPKILRPKLNQDFAVLLMRSSYQALDKIDCVAMVRFCLEFRRLLVDADALLMLLSTISGSISKRLFPHSTSRVRALCE